MQDLNLSQDLAQQFVNGVMKGFTNYVNRRKQDSNDLLISRAGAWMKGNFIDDAVANEVDKLSIDYQIKMAGYSWEYLQFDFFDKFSDTNNSLIVKNYKTLTNGMSDRDNKLPDYLAKDAIGNVDILNKNKEKIRSTGNSIQLELLPTVLDNSENVTAKSSNYQNRFYVVGYNLGTDGNIELLKLLMPNPSTNSLVEIKDWTEYIVDAPIQPNVDDLTILNSDKDVPEGQYDDSSSMKYEVANDNTIEKDN